MSSSQRRQCCSLLARNSLPSSSRQRHTRRASNLRRTPEPTSPQLASLLASYAKQPPKPLTLGTLLSLGNPLTPESVLTSVAYAQAEIPRRLATRIRSLEGLPFIVGTNPYVARIMDGFRRSFEGIVKFGEEVGGTIKTLEDNERFAEMLEGLVRDRANDIPTVAKG